MNVRRSWLDVVNDPVYMAKLAKGFELMRGLDGDSKNQNSLKNKARVRTYTMLGLSAVRNACHGFLPFCLQFVASGRRVFVAGSVTR